MTEPDARYMTPTDVVPRPDPTTLTTAAVERALDGYREVVDIRLAAMDKATELVARDSARIAAAQETNRELLRNDVERQLAALREFILTKIDSAERVGSERFAGISTQFAERDTRLEQTDRERRISLDAALAAAKEAVAEQQKANALAIGKSEDGTKERLDALAQLMTTEVKSLQDKIDDIKGRIDRGEGQSKGAVDTRAESRLNLGQVLLAISVIVGVVALIITFR